MKKIVTAIILLGLVVPASASEVNPPRIIVEWLIKAVHEGNSEVAGWYFTFDKEKHGDLTSLSRDGQIQLLKDIPPDKIVFDKDKYTMEEGKRFVVRLVAPKKLEFEMEYVELRGDRGPPWKYTIRAIRETAPPPAGIDGKPAPKP